MMIIIKFLIAGIIALCWYFFDNSQEIALILFVIVFVALLFQPQKQRNLQEEDDFKEKIKNANERKVKIEERRIIEQKDAQHKMQHKKI